MIPISLEARDIPEAWFLCLKKLVENMNRTKLGVHMYTTDVGSFKEHKRLEFDFVTIHIKYPNTRPLIPDVPLGIPAPTTQEYIDNYLPYLMTSEVKENEQYTYGQYLEPQIKKVIKMYKNGGHNTNQAFMAVGDKDSLDLSDPPCLRQIDTRIIDNKLSFIVYFRSWDLWGGLPSNLGGIQILKEYMASEIGVEDGELIACSKGLHLYDYSWELAKCVINR